MALLREVARRALWHMPNSSDEVRDLARHLYLENLRQPHPRDDDPPERCLPMTLGSPPVSPEFPGCDGPADRRQRIRPLSRRGPRAIAWLQRRL
jgi:hypothetical protein